MDRLERMYTLGLRIGSLPRDYAHAIMERYVELAGGWSWDPEARALTDDDLDTLEKMLVEAVAECAGRPDALN